MKLLFAMLAGGLGACYYLGCEAKARKSGVKKEDLTRWEGEGGNVPAVATPSPAPQPQSSYPTPDARH
jgi:hypothetical protein